MTVMIEYINLILNLRFTNNTRLWFLEERSPLDALETFDDRNILASVIKILTIIIQVIKSCFRNLWQILINRKFLSVLLNQRRVLFVNRKFNMRFMYSIITVIIYKNLVSDFCSWQCKIQRTSEKVREIPEFKILISLPYDCFLMTNINNVISYYMFPFSLTCLH
jgi:hypothetical protein